ncbi:hypothetical protein AMR72_09855 [Flavobacterium psychrophilum]|nr:hypothetical protein AMR72_09855 [Flavobacterium psychrophilum]AOE52784.1 hypothetical protein ALW18_09845 [Flavobacterium psychrophilum]
MNRLKRLFIYQIYFCAIIFLLSIVGIYSLTNEDLLILPYQTTLFVSFLLFIMSLFLILRAYLKLSELDSRFPKHYFDKSKNKDKEDDNRESASDILFDLLDEKRLEKFREKFIEKFEEAYLANLALNYGSFTYLEALDEIEYNTKRQIKRLTYNSNLNLIIGIIINSLGILLLFISLYNFDSKATIDVFAFFLPRLTVVLFIQIFSFFFLKLYKECLIDIKYFENEITNCTFKIMALKVALDRNDVDTINNIILQFSKTEKNSLIDKGKTTEKIELLKNETSLVQSLSSIIENILRKQKDT